MGTMPKNSARMYTVSEFNSVPSDSMMYGYARQDMVKVLVVKRSPSLILLAGEGTGVSANYFANLCNNGFVVLRTHPGSTPMEPLDINTLSAVAPYKPLRGFDPKGALVGVHKSPNGLWWATGVPHALTLEEVSSGYSLCIMEEPETFDNGSWELQR